MLTLNPLRHEVKIDGKKITLTPKEFLIAQYALERKGYVINRPEIIGKVWRESKDLHPRTVDQHIARLRSKLGRSGRSFLTTIPSFGYRADDGKIVTD